MVLLGGGVHDVRFASVHTRFRTRRQVFDNPSTDMSSAAVPPESFVPDFQTNTPPPVTTPPTAVGDTAIPSSTSQSTPTAPPNTTDTTSLPQSQIGKSTAAPSTQNSTRTHSETGDGPSTTTWTLTEHLAANAFTSANSPSEVLVIVSTTVTQLPATSMTTMTTQVVTQTSIVTRYQ
ncbi:hypothetical protein L218DRAFT_87230 [Marasmius fiardii PR-910]|nr:hypothetical protein L218DRAFT_87230 [Marasmius fiardii PR-910]